jgi:glycosyltransferase involved in cell wall biosynthesis
MNNPLISIITVVYNGVSTLEQTIFSVINQTYKNIEYIIIDGGSTDGTIDIIKKYEKHLAYWVSEPDNGIADAFNKGIKKAAGDLIGLINSDDYLFLDALSIVSKYYVKNRNQIISGALRLENPKRCDKIWQSTLKNIDIEMTIAHPATFVPKQFYELYGGFDIAYKVSMDYDFIYKMISNNVDFNIIPDILITMRSGGMSARNSKIGLKENYLIQQKYNKNFSIFKALSYICKRKFQIMAINLCDKIGIGKIISIYIKRSFIK